MLRAILSGLATVAINIIVSFLVILTVAYVVVALMIQAIVAVVKTITKPML